MKRIKELDFTRVIAMFAVVMIHVTSTYINQDSSFILFDMNLAFILNQVSRFSVPLFIVLSGISLGFSKPIGDPLLFYKKRLVKIGIPYLFWFTAYIVDNSDTILAAWYVNNIECSINTTMSESDLKRVIDSIYEE